MEFKTNITDTPTKFHIVNIQNLERKEEIINSKLQASKIKKPTTDLNKVKFLSKNYYLKEEDVYYYIDTSTNIEQTFEVNNFICGFMNAYNTHSDVILNPDNIWIMVSLYFSSYVNKYEKELKTNFVSFEKQKKIVVKEYVDDVEQSLKKEKEWNYFYEQIYEQVKENTKEGVVDALKCDFSTTSTIENIISTSIIMNTFKKYFSYGRIICSCGINNIYFEGIREDWVKLIAKTENLAKYDVDTELTKYIENILPILKQFLNTWDNIVDVDFWNKIMTTEEKRIGSGSDIETKIEGWILNFFGKYEKMDLDDIPDYSISVPIELKNELTGITKELDLVANFSSVSKLSKYVYKSDFGLAIIHNQKPKCIWQ